MHKVAIGTMVFNEGRNLGRLLSVLTRARPQNCEIVSLVVVSSGSTDNSVDVAKEWSNKDPRVLVITEPKRSGKAAAINRFLREIPEGVDVCVIASADIVPREDTVERLVAPFGDPAVGMTGAHPAPTNPRRGLINRVVRMQWDLHHRIASERPKLGELIAFRNVVPEVDPATAVDEAFLEAVCARLGMKLRYVGDAVVYNHGPENLREFLRQRRRIWAGHLWLKRRTGYEVATYRTRRLLRAFFWAVRRNPLDVSTLVAGAGLEALCRICGTYDLLVRRYNPQIWEPLASTKQPRLSNTEDAGSVPPVDGS